MALRLSKFPYAFVTLPRLRCFLTVELVHGRLDAFGVVHFKRRISALNQVFYLVFWGKRIQYVVNDIRVCGWDADP